MDLQGDRYGQWLVLDVPSRQLVQPSGQKRRQWQCECDCGRQQWVDHANLRSGRSTRCKPCQEKLLRERIKARIYSG